MTRRCLLCKAFIRRAHATNCKRCGSANYDTTIQPADRNGVYMTTTGPTRFAYKVSTLR